MRAVTWQGRRDVRVGDVPDLAVGDRVVVPFQIACGACFMCDRGLHTQCETTQVREHGMGAQLFGCTDLYGSVPGGQAQYLRVPLEDAASAYAMFQAKEDDAIKVVFTP